MSQKSSWELTNGKILANSKLLCICFTSDSYRNIHSVRPGNQSGCRFHDNICFMHVLANGLNIRKVANILEKV